MLNFSAPSAKLSSGAIVNVEEVVPALITTLATPGVKSVPLTATPLYVKLTVKSVVGLEK